MKSNSSKHSSDIDVDVSNNTVSIKPLKSLGNPNLKYQEAKRRWKILIFNSTTTLNDNQKILKTHFIKVYFEKKNSDSHLENKNNQAHQLSSCIQVDSCLLKKLEKLLYSCTMQEYQRLNYIRKISGLFPATFYIHYINLQEKRNDVSKLRSGSKLYKAKKRQNTFKSILFQEDIHDLTTLSRQMRKACF